MSEVYNCSQHESRMQGLARAASVIRNGGMVLLPTDTSYGIGCDAFNPAAAARVRNLKDLPANAPLSVLVGSWHTIDGLTLGVTTRVRELIEAFWPGGLSLVISHSLSLAWDIGDTRGTVVIRMPLHPVALELIREVGPMIVSAVATVNEETSDVSTAYAKYVQGVEICLDSGVPPNQDRSTIIDTTGEELIVLREGSVPISAIRSVAGRDVRAAQGEQ